MADRFPLILNTSANQIQEIASGDSLDLTGSNISNAGIITAGNVTIGAATTDLIVNGDARITGILTIGTSSLKLDGPNNLVNVGTALTLGHTQGLQFHTQNLHSAGFDVNQINVSGASTIGGNLDANGDLDVDGHTNLDNVNVVGVLTVTGAVNASHSTFGNLNTTGVTIQNTNASINFTDTNNNPDYSVIVDAGVFDLNSVSPSVNVVKINTDGHIDIGTNVDFAAGIDVTGNATVSGNLSVGGVLTYEDVTNVDSIGIITARDGIDCNGDIDVDGHTNLDNVSVAGVSTFTGNADFSAGVDVTGTITATGEIRSQDDIRIQSNYPRFYLTDTDSNNDYSLINNNGNFLIYDDTAGAYRIKVDGTNTIFASNQRPAADSTYDIGTNTLRWQNLFVDDVTVTGVVTATTFVGNLTGNVTGNASSATEFAVTSNNTTNETVYPLFVDGNSGTQGAEVDTAGLTFNPSTNTLTAGTFSGSISATTGSFSGDVTFSGGAGAITLSAGSDIRMSSGTWTGEHAGKIQYHSNKMYFQGGSNGHQLRDNIGTTTFEINPSGTCAGVSLTLAQAVTHNADVTFSGGASAVTVNAGSDIRIAGGTWTGEYTGGIKIQPDANNSYIQYHGNLYFRHSGGSNRFLINQSGEAYIMSTADGVLNLNTTASNGAFMRFRKPSSSDTSLHVGVAKGIAAGSDTDDGAVYAGRGNLILRAYAGVINFTDGGAASSGIDIVTRGGGTSGNDANSQTSPFIRFRDYPASSYFNSTTVDDNNWAIGADDSGVSEFKIVYGGGSNSNRITSIQANSQTGTTVMGFQSDLQVTTTGFKVTETAETSGTSSVGGSTRNAHYDATPSRGTYLVHGHITYRDNAPGGPDPDQVRLVLQVDGSDIAHASILDEDSNNTARNQEDSFAALITVNGSQNVQVETYTTDPGDPGGADYRYRINIFKLGG